MHDSWQDYFCLDMDSRAHNKTLTINHSLELLQSFKNEFLYA